MEFKGALRAMENGNRVCHEELGKNTFLEMVHRDGESVIELFHESSSGLSYTEPLAGLIKTKLLTSCRWKIYNKPLVSFTEGLRALKRGASYIRAEYQPQGSITNTKTVELRMTVGGQLVMRSPLSQLKLCVDSMLSDEWEVVK
jgi:hypothetical protein